MYDVLTARRMRLPRLDVRKTMPWKYSRCRRNTDEVRKGSDAIGAGRLTSDQAVCLQSVSTAS